MKRAITLLVLVSLVLAACTKKQESPTPLPTAQKATAIPATIAPGATATKSPVEGQTIPRLEIGRLINISYVQMFDPLQGWGVGGLAGQDEHILRTYDNGQTWQEVSPPEPLNLEGKIKHAMAYFTSFQEGWATYYLEEYIKEPLSIWYTTDGGQTWQTSEPLDAQGLDIGLKPESLTFIDNQRGWLMLTGEASGGKTAAVLFRTTNGGASWQRITTPFDKNSGSIDSCCRTGMVFLDADLGIITSQISTNPKPTVNWTTDGGKTWVQQEILPADEKVFANSVCSTYSPDALSPTSAVMVVDCLEFNVMEQKHYAYLYLTTDRGQNWQWLELPWIAVGEGKWETIVRTPKVLFIDAQVGWFFIEDAYTHKDPSKNTTKNQMWQTRDGGQNWTKIGTTLWFGQYNFLNADVGWAIATQADTHILVKTTDGGGKWLTFQPTVRE